MATTSAVGQYNESTPVLANNEQRALRLDVTGRTIITQEKRATYSASISGLAVVTGATDFFTVTGSATRTIIVKRIRYSGTASQSTQVPLALLIRSTANSGGTSTTLTNVPHDSVNAVATATVRAYTANPTRGTLVGSIRSPYYTFTAANSNSLTVELREIRLGEEEDQGVVLRGVNESLCFNLNSTAISGALMGCSVEWREIVGG